MNAIEQKIIDLIKKELTVEEISEMVNKPIIYIKDVHKDLVPDLKLYSKITKNTDYFLRSLKKENGIESFIIEVTSELDRNQGFYRKWLQTILPALNDKTTKVELNKLVKGSKDVLINIRKHCNIDPLHIVSVMQERKRIQNIKDNIKAEKEPSIRKLSKKLKVSTSYAERVVFTYLKDGVIDKDKLVNTIRGDYKEGMPIHELVKRYKLSYKQIEELVSDVVVNYDYNGFDIHKPQRYIAEERKYDSHTKNTYQAIMLDANALDYNKIVAKYGINVITKINFGLKTDIRMQCLELRNQKLVSLYKNLNDISELYKQTLVPVPELIKILNSNNIVPHITTQLGYKDPLIIALAILKYTDRDIARIASINFTDMTNIFERNKVKRRKIDSNLKFTIDRLLEEDCGLSQEEIKEKNFFRYQEKLRMQKQSDPNLGSGDMVMNEPKVKTKGKDDRPLLDRVKDDIKVLDYKDMIKKYGQDAILHLKKEERFDVKKMCNVAQKLKLYNNVSPGK